MATMQTECTGDSLEFSIEPVYGVRRWRPTSYGGTHGTRMCGMYEQVWELTGDEYVAECGTDPTLNHELTLNPAPTDSFTSILGKLLDNVSPLIPDIYRDTRQFNCTAISLRIMFTLKTTVNDSTGYYTEAMSISAASLSATSEPHEMLFYCIERLIRSLDWSIYQVMGCLDRLDMKISVSSNGTWKHTVAHPRCTCGVYAYHTLQGFAENIYHEHKSQSQIFGLVQGYGHTTLGTLGWRAEKVKILGIYVTPNVSEDFHVYKTVAASQGLEVYSSVNELISAANRYNVLLPDGFAFFNSPGTVD